MYYQYWGMHKAPFDNVPDPSLYWAENKSLEDAVAEIIFAIEEGNDCLAVMVGEIGTGKTMGLRVILNELDPEKYRVAFITNPDLSSVQLMREIIGQLKNKKITTRYKDQLMEEFNALLFDCANKGQKVVVFIDEANVMSCAQLHQLRLMTNLQDDQQNMIIFVLAGQKELGKRLESKALENLYQRIGVYCRIKGLSGPDAVREYLAHRIKSCGGSPDIFSQEACEAIWLYSHHGVPRIINKMAKLCLKAGETNQVKKIEADLVKAIASMFEHERVSSDNDTHSSDGDDQEEVSHLDLPKRSSQAGLDFLSPRFDHEIDQDQEMVKAIQRFSPAMPQQVHIMEDKQLMDIAGKIAIQHIQQTQPKNSGDDPVIIWHTIKGRIFSTLKSMKEPQRSYV